ncbi:hypothetical protein BLX87_23595 [Bacillus sp. VT-16-64]|nr:hypothetical protein BLX87_23595 [Bacillus sp. VT-16-64]
MKTIEPILQIGQVLKKTIAYHNGFYFICDLSETPQVWYESSGKKRQVTEINGRVNQFVFSPDGKKMMILFDVDGKEMDQITMLDLKVNTYTPIAIDHQYFHFFGAWSPDGKQLVYTRVHEEQGLFELMVYDASSGRNEKIYSSPSKLVPVKWFDNTLLLKEEHTLIHHQLHVFDLQANELKQHLLPRPARCYGADIDEHTNHLYVAVDLEGEFTSVNKYQLKSGEKQLLVQAEWDIVDFKRSPDGEKLAFVTNENGVSRLFLFAESEGTKKQIESIPYGTISSLIWLNNDEFAFVCDGPTHPGEIWSYSIPKEKLAQQTNMTKSAPLKGLLVRPVERSFKSFDQLEIPYFHYSKSHGKIKRPAIVFIHGGPEFQAVAEFSPLFQSFVQFGFDVIVPNIRGSNGYGKSFIHLDDKQRRTDAMKDVAALIQHLKSNPEIDQDRIAIMGESYGGYMVLSILTQYPELCAAGIDVVGMSDLNQFFQHTAHWRRKMREAEYGGADELKAFFHSIAPLTNAEKLNKPLYIFHGKNDIRVSINESINMLERLKDKKNIHSLFFENEGHEFYHRKNLTIYYQEVLHFLRSHLTGWKS